MWSLIDEIFIKIQNYYEILPTHTSKNFFEAKIEFNLLSIPERVYLDCYILSLLQDEHRTLGNSLSPVLYCIFSRHNNWFIREICLKKLIKFNPENHPFIAVYILALSWDYIADMLPWILDHVVKYEQFYKELILENEEITKKNLSRIVSYWNEYYRFNSEYWEQFSVCEKFTSYVGYPLYVKLKKLLKQ